MDGSEPHLRMMVHHVREVVDELVKARPEPHVVDFKLTCLGSLDEPWSINRDGFGWKAYIPDEEIAANWKWAETTTNNFSLLPDDCERVFGLGSAYAFISCRDDTPLYIGMAGEASLDSRIREHLQTPRILRDEEGKPAHYRFEKHKWANRPNAETPRSRIPIGAIERSRPPQIDR